jgi:hypothetical protein
MMVTPCSCRLVLALLERAKLHPPASERDYGRLAPECQRRNFQAEPATGNFGPEMAVVAPISDVAALVKDWGETAAVAQTLSTGACRNRPDLASRTKEDLSERISFS